MTQSCPVFEGVAPETPKLWIARGDFEPVMKNEQEVVRSRLQPAEITFEDDVPTENISKYFGGKLENVQQRVPSAFELGQVPFLLSDPLVQSPGGIDVNLATKPVL